MKHNHPYTISRFLESPSVRTFDVQSANPPNMLLTYETESAEQALNKAVRHFQLAGYRSIPPLTVTEVF